MDGKLIIYYMIKTKITCLQNIKTQLFRYKVHETLLLKNVKKLGNIEKPSNNLTYMHNPNLLRYHSLVAAGLKINMFSPSFKPNPT